MAKQPTKRSRRLDLKKFPTIIDASFDRWWKGLGKFDGDAAIVGDTAERVVEGCRRVSEEPTDAMRIYHGVTRGTKLLKAALEWDDPFVGSSLASTSRVTGKRRGSQWRCVMAWAGLEILLKSCGTFRGRHHRQDLDYLAKQCHPEGLVPISSPKTQQFGLWVEDETALIEFLDPHAGKDVRPVITKWTKQDISEWPELLLLAYAFRNFTAHGALSATKVGDWGLQRAIESLTYNVGLSAVAILDRLGQTTTDPAR